MLISQIACRNVVVRSLLLAYGLLLCGCDARVTADMFPMRTELNDVMHRAGTPDAICDERNESQQFYLPCARAPYQDCSLFYLKSNLEVKFEGYHVISVNPIDPDLVKMVLIPLKRRGYITDEEVVSYFRFTTLRELELSNY